MQCNGKSLIGCLLVGMVAFLWVGSSYLLQYMQSLGFDKPFFITWFNTTVWSSFLLGYFFMPSWRALPWSDASAASGTPGSIAGLSSRSIQEPDQSDMGSHITRNLLPERCTDEPQSTPTRQVTLKFVITTAALFAPLWFMANVTFNGSVMLTSVTSNNILSNTSSLFVLALGIVVLREQFSFAKALATLVCFSGVVLVALVDQHQSCGGCFAPPAPPTPELEISHFVSPARAGFVTDVDNVTSFDPAPYGPPLPVSMRDALAPARVGAAAQSEAATQGASTPTVAPDEGDGLARSVLGDFLAIASAFGYAAYALWLRVRVPADMEKDYPMSLMFGFVGLVVLIAGWPIVFITHFAGAEVVSMPSAHVMLLIITNSLVGTNLSDIMWANAVVLTSPLVATLGLGLTVPISMLSETFICGCSFSPPYVVGAVMILFGFTLANLIAGGVIDESMVADTLTRCLGVDIRELELSISRILMCCREPRVVADDQVRLVERSQTG